MPEKWPEVFVSKSTIASSISKALKKGLLKKLASRVYTSNLHEKPEVLVRRHLWYIVGALFPGALIADRTALEHRPAPDGSVFVISTKKRSVELPGIVIRPRKGVEPLDDDKPFMSGLFLSSLHRAYLENMRPSRRSKKSISRCLSKKEMEERLEFLLRTGGQEALQSLRDKGRRIAPLAGLAEELRKLDSLIGSLLGSRDTPLLSPTAKAWREGAPYDPNRLELFQSVFEWLIKTPPITRYAKSEGTALPFFEAYFSNFIEGTEFQVQEAAEIIFEGKIPAGRPEDAHDIIGTYHITSDAKEMKRTPKNVEEFFTILKSRHALVMQGRPEKMPGEFKIQSNRAGMTIFVAPNLVKGTLEKGFELYSALNTPFQKAVFMMFLVAEVHPFSDGNGRCARLMMNAELVKAEEVRIIIPTIYRNNYLAAMKATSYHGKIEALVRTLDFAQKYTSLINWSSLEQAKADLEKTNAFYDPQEADAIGIRLILPWS